MSRGHMTGCKPYSVSLVSVRAAGAGFPVRRGLCQPTRESGNGLGPGGYGGDDDK